MVEEKERTIMIFPKLSNMAVIDEIRQKYDPLADLVRPHITLMFPFKSAMTIDEIHKLVLQAVSGIAPFELELNGFSTEISKFGNYLFLNVAKGTEQITELHQRLYKGKNKFPYHPHITVGSLKTPEQLDAAFEDVKDCKEVFSTLVDTVSVEIIGGQGESIIELEQKLV